MTIAVRVASSTTKLSDNVVRSNIVDGKVSIKVR